jgi:hypothetical protein
MMRINYFFEPHSQTQILILSKRGGHTSNILSGTVNHLFIHPNTITLELISLICYFIEQGLHDKIFGSVGKV